MRSVAESEPAATIQPGRRIGPYRLLQEIGRGGAGVVWRARHEETGQLVALKSVHEGRFHFVSSLAREVRALQRIEHPGIVRILSFGESEGRPWYAMDLLVGETLFGQWTLHPSGQDSLGRPARGQQSTLQLEPASPGSDRPADELPAARRERLDPLRLRRLLTLMRRMCAPLAFLHGEGLVHRDLKPSNVIIRDDDTPVLTDFGLAWHPRDADERERLDDLAGIAGTVGYMSPERIRGQSEDPRSDLYSLGCMLYEGLIGRPPFWGGSSAEVLDKHLLVTPARPSRDVEGVPPELDDLILKLLAKNPEQRPGHADDIAEVLAGLGGEPWPDEGQMPVPRPYLYRPALAGRQDELAALQQILRKGEEGRGSLTVVCGPSGIGKTALVMTLCRLAWRQGWQVMTGECVPVAGYTADTRAAPFHPFARLLGTAAEIGQREPERIGELLGTDIGFLAAYEPALGRLPGVSPPPDASTLPPEAAQERVVRALADLVGRLARQRPLLVIVDDLQWADSLSLAFLTALRADDFIAPGARLVVLGTLRPEEGGPWLRPLLDLPFVSKVALEPLTEAAVGELVGAMMAQPDPPARLVQLAWRDSEGHPLLAGETVRSALAQGLLSRDPTGQWTVRVGLEDNLAGTQHRRLAALLERRLSGLTATAHGIMQMAAVLGREVHVPLLQALSARVSAGAGSDRDLLDGLTELHGRQILEERAGEIFRFAHDRLRELAYQLIPAPLRPPMHRASVDAFEARAAAGMDLRPSLSIIAFHAAEGGDLRRAIAYSERAGEFATARGANAEAARLFRQALDLAAATDPPVDDLRRARWERRAGEALEGIGDLEGAKQHLRRAGALLGWPEPSTTGMALGLIWNMGRQLIRRTLRSPRPVRLSQRPRWEEAALTYETLVHIAYYQSAALPLVYSTFQGLALAERCPDSAALSAAYSYGYATLNVTPFRTRAGAYLRLAERALERRPDAAAHSYSLLLQAVAHFGDGKLAEVDRCARAAMELADSLGFRRRWEESANALANANHLHGHSDQALAWSGRVIASARSRGDGQTLTWTLAVRGAAYLDTGLVDEALIDLREAATLAPAVGRNETVWARGLLAAALLRQGDRDQALTVSRQALADLRRSPPVFVGAVDGYAAAAAVPLALLEELAQQGRSDPALRRDVRQALGCLKAFARIFPVAGTRLWLAQGRWLLLRGKSRAATAALQASAAGAVRLQLAPDQARAQLWLAVAEHRSPEKRRQHLEQALPLFEASGQYQHVQIVRRGLARPAEFRLPIELRV